MAKIPTALPVFAFNQSLLRLSVISAGKRVLSHIMSVSNTNAQETAPVGLHPLFNALHPYRQADQILEKLGA